MRAILEVIEREQGTDRTRGLHDALAQMQLAYAHAVQLDSAERDAAREKAHGAGAAEEPASGTPPQADCAGRGPRSGRRREAGGAEDAGGGEEACGEEGGAEEAGREEEAGSQKKKPAGES